MIGPRLRDLGLLALLASLLPAAPGGLSAQLEAPPRPAAYALEGVTVVHADGRRQADVTLVVRDGLIETLEAGAAVPPDARRLEGDSLTVYPGIIDAFGEAALEVPEGPERGEVVPWSPGRVAQGFTPHWRTTDFLSATGGDLRGQRRSGVVAAGVFPRDGLAAGRGATLLFRPGAGHPRELVAHPETGLYMSFQGASGGYPSTLFGVIAFMRQSYADARRTAELHDRYRRDPTGMTLPPWDADYEVLRRTATGELPVYFHADGAEDARRALGLAEELGFSPIIVGGGQAWKLADELARRDVPVVVSLDFPSPDAWDPEADTAGRLEPAAAREKERLENLYRNPSRLLEAGVTVALTSEAGRADLREGVRKVIEYGFPEDAALRAVTTNPAALLGIPGVARVREGFAATFVVADGPLFAEETSLRYTFVEGALEEVDGGGGPSPGDEPPAVDVTGSWSAEMSAQGQAVEFEMTLEQEGARFDGTMRGGQFGEARVTNGVVSGNDVRFNIIIEAGPETLELQATGTVEGSRMEGRGRGGGPVGAFEFTATRTPGGGGVR